MGHERVARDAHAGLFFIARAGEEVAGVMRFELDDPYFSPEVEPGTSGFIHKLAVPRVWAKKGVSTDRLSFARARTQALGRPFLQLDCVADRLGLRNLYEDFGFSLHRVVQRGPRSSARYELRTTR
ncbi:GNAT family N-acetyltransferase [Variovorax sp. MHTC-1]|uniref:GNAT family N-acetyltransferase n=1 Tax=Variovorax sp. MHTC-1 TaxID=2495593 RepID=UPI000F8930A3|nr:GNAT family N-acetyltransferase [Variovorax sp. MHTC-1]RST50155.1 GNAT family N-acetyltransferase [Variovorax sp. MHTC-1]